jgi:hypothetical protein
MNTSTCAAVAHVLASRRRAGLSRGRCPGPPGSLALLAAASLALAACGSGASPGASSLLKDTFSPHKPISSGVLALSFALNARGGAPGAKGSFSLELAGPFESTDTGRLPHFALALTLDTAGRTLRAGATSTAGHLYLQLGGVSFLAPAASMRALEQGYAQASGGSSSARSRAAFATLGIDPAAWLTHPSIAGSATVAGAETVHILSGLDTARFLADVERLSSAGLSLGAGQGAAPLTPARSAALAASVRAARVDVYAGARDHLLRRLALSAAVSTTPAARAALGGLAGGTLSFVLQFTQLDRPQTIAAPRNSRPLSRLGPALERLGLARALGPRA